MAWAITHWFKVWFRHGVLFAFSLLVFQILVYRFASAECLRSKDVFVYRYCESQRAADNKRRVGNYSPARYQLRRLIGCISANNSKAFVNRLTLFSVCKLFSALNYYWKQTAFLGNCRKCYILGKPQMKAMFLRISIDLKGGFKPGLLKSVGHGQQTNLKKLIIFTVLPLFFSQKLCFLRRTLKMHKCLGIGGLLHMNMTFLYFFIF